MGVKSEVIIDNNGAYLPGLIDRAAAALVGARTSAEVLEAREMASLAYDAAKRTARLQRAKNAFNALVAASNRAQADALEIEAAANRRLADEYDAAQERGEIASSGDTLKQGPGVPKQNSGKATAADLGLSRKSIHEARIMRDAEKAEPGIVRRTLNAALDAGEEPTRAKVRRAAFQASGRTPAPSPQRGKAAVCARVREAITQLSGLPPAREVARYLAACDDGVLVAERLPAVRTWINELSDAMEVADADHD